MQMLQDLHLHTLCRLFLVLNRAPRYLNSPAEAYPTQAHCKFSSHIITTGYDEAENSSSYGDFKDQV
jgi:hypothetical protein